MIHFKPINLSDKPAADRILQNTALLGCEFCFGSLFMWKELYGSSIFIENGLLTVYSQSGQGYLCPVGAPDLREAVLWLHQDAQERGIPFKLLGLDDSRREMLEQLFPGRFDFVTSPDNSDYLYASADLANLPGKKYHKKRNHIARFLDQYDFYYEPITSANLPECIALYDQWLDNKFPENPKLIHERQAMELAFSHYFSLGFHGGLIRITARELAGKVVAFTFGEPVNGRVFAVHAEKANPLIQGAYPLINREFSKTLSAYEFINREEDMGLEGLRRAKQSYYPALLLTRYHAVWK